MLCRMWEQKARVSHVGCGCPVKFNGLPGWYMASSNAQDLPVWSMLSRVLLHWLHGHLIRKKVSHMNSSEKSSLGDKITCTEPVRSRLGVRSICKESWAPYCVVFSSWDSLKSKASKGKEGHEPKKQVNQRQSSCLKGRKLEIKVAGNQGS